MTDKKTKDYKHENAVEHVSASQMALQQRKRKSLLRLLIAFFALVIIGGVVSFFAFQQEEAPEEEAEPTGYTITDSVTEIEGYVVNELYVEEQGGEGIIEITDDSYSAHHIFITQSATLTWINGSSSACELELAKLSGEVMMTEVIESGAQLTEQIDISDEGLSFECLNDHRKGGYIRDFGV